MQGIYVYAFSKDCLALTSISLFLGSGKEMQNSCFGIYSLNVYVMGFFKNGGVKSVLLSTYLYMFNVS